MTTQPQERTLDMHMDQLLELFDTMTGYGIDSYSREQLAKLDPNDSNRHVTDKKTAYRIVDTYIKDRYTRLNGRAPKTDRQRNSIVQNDGFLQNATFNRNDILLMMDDKIVQRALAQQFHGRTVLLQGVYIPVVVADTHPIDPANQNMEMEDYL